MMGYDPKEFNPNRLRLARKRRLLNKKELAAKIDVSTKSIARCEGELAEPTPQIVTALAVALGFPVEFFQGPDVDEPDPSLVSFRSQSAMSAALRDAALAAGAIGFMVSDWVEARFALPEIKVPDLHLFEPEAAARTLRQEWNLGERPISNMVHLLESKGVRVFSLAENSKRVNAYSLWRRGKPYVFLNNYKSAESSRFDAAHELAHLVMHQDGRLTGRDAEDQANRFASEFLMPTADVLAEITGVVSLGRLIAAKERWIVSLAALNHKVHRVGLTTDWKYRDLCIQLAERGYNTREPNEAKRERSVVWQKVLTAMWADRKPKSTIAADLALPEAEVDTLLFGILFPDQQQPRAPAKSLSLV